LTGNPTYGFVLGTGRCGSTLVHELLARHHAVGFLSNVEDRLPLPAVAGRLNQPIYHRVPARFTEKGRVRFAPSEGYRALTRDVSPLLSESPHDLTAGDATGPLAERFRTFFTRRADAQRRPLFLHKFTGWPRVGLIDATLPDVRYVHVVRDGRAVASSWLQMPWWKGDPAVWQWGPLPDAYDAEWKAADRSPVLLAGLAWKMLLDAFAKARVHDDRWLEVRYEDVVAEPVATVERVAAHLGLDWSPELAKAVTSHPFDPRATTRWRADLTAQDVALLTESLGEHLARFGYEA
jgi:hypothetical protein